MLLFQEEKIRNILSGAKSVAIVLSDEATEEALLSQEALAEAIRIAGISVQTYPERQKWFAAKWASIIPASDSVPATFSTSILIPKNKIETKEVSYTEDTLNVSINISASEKISKENVTFKTLPEKVDAVFYFSPSGQSQPDGKLSEELFQEMTVPNQDNIVAVSFGAGEGTLSEKVFSIINIIESGGDVSIKKFPIPDLLMASLLIETDHFQKNLGKEVLELASSLMKLDANEEKISGILDDKSSSFARLLGRALARSYSNESLKSMWTFIANQDLEKTGNEPAPALFSKIIKKIKNLLEPRPFFVLIWQSKKEVWGMIWVSPQNSPGTGEKIASLLPAKKENGGLISGPYKNFSEAELKIQKVLKEVV